MKLQKKNVKRIINKIFFPPKIKIKGKNNNVNYPDTAYLRRVSIEIYGDNNTIDIQDNAYLHNTHIIIGFSSHKINNTKIRIGKNTGFNSLNMQVGESNSYINIGDDCMFSYDIEITCTDHHSIFNENNEIINIGKSIEIGSHVWAGKEVRIMKNTKIPDGCIIAQRSIVTRKFDKENCILAGNPAKIVKENIHWTKDRPDKWILK